VGIEAGLDDLGRGKKKKQNTKHLPAIKLHDSLVDHRIAWSLYLTETAKSIKLAYEMKPRTHNIVPAVLSATVMAPKTLHRSWQLLNLKEGISNKTHGSAMFGT